ncbi:HesA/MoeB/ThiF family protein [Confluentibacter sediminis]|uniref:HesA/MoeB/ThiF family protein n=1 Tax=Confluentibacter sediminis TaxID=2219045 RepID=UPI000DAED657|nr:ThiF family adenylyltransferase [Confluentibacter sediminis]
MMHVKITEMMHQELKNHLHNGDGLEALGFALCGRLKNKGEEFLLVHKTFLMPYDKCNRSKHFVSWKTIDVEHLLEEALAKGLGIIKFHSHFVNHSNFSDLDDKSDKDFFDSVYGWTNNQLPHASVIMYPDGAMKGRVIKPDLSFTEIDKISIIGENVRTFTKNNQNIEILKSFKRNSQAFGDKTVNTLKEMKIGVIGCSGTGSPLIQMLFRLGVGKLVLIDSDVIGHENLNRIVVSTSNDADNNKLKVEVLKEHIDHVNIGTEVVTYSCLIQESREALNELASCDFIFGCMDSVEGRHYINLISTDYLVPLIDIGIKLVADGEGGIDSILGNIHYVYPNSKTLMERGVYTPKQLSAESLKRLSEEEYNNRQAYFENADVESPAVISVNTMCSSLAVNDMLSRIHPYRYRDNSMYSHTTINLTDWDLNSFKVDKTLDKSHFENIGIGSLEPNLKLYVSDKVI